MELGVTDGYIHLWQVFLSPSFVFSAVAAVYILGYIVVSLFKNWREIGNAIRDQRWPLSVIFAIIIFATVGRELSEFKSEIVVACVVSVILYIFRELPLFINDKKKHAEILDGFKTKRDEMLEEFRLKRDELLEELKANALWVMVPEIVRSRVQKLDKECECYRPNQTISIVVSTNPNCTYIKSINITSVYTLKNDSDKRIKKKLFYGYVLTPGEKEWNPKILKAIHLDSNGNEITATTQDFLKDKTPAELEDIAKGGIKKVGKIFLEPGSVTRIVRQYEVICEENMLSVVQNTHFVDPLGCLKIKIMHTCNGEKSCINEKIENCLKIKPNCTANKIKKIPRGEGDNKQETRFKAEQPFFAGQGFWIELKIKEKSQKGELRPHKHRGLQSERGNTKNDNENGDRNTVPPVKEIAL